LPRLGHWRYNSRQRHLTLISKESLEAAMPHDLPEDHQHWREPTDNKTKSGFGTFTRPNMPYDDWMESQDIPIFRGLGVRKCQDLPLEPWKLYGGRGTFIQLWGTEGLWGSFVLEVPGAGATNAVKHLYEQQFLVIEGRGSTEVWEDGREDKKHVFEWQAGSMFAIPLNARYRMINAASSPARLLGGNIAPQAINTYRNTDFIFDCPYAFRDRFDPDAEDYFKPNDDIVADPVRGLAMKQTNILPDVINCELPLDNRRSPGYRRIEPHMARQNFYLWIAQHETGRYSKAHAHGSAAVLICLRGKGYTYTWPYEIGPTPWKDGKADKVMRQDYEPVGMVTAAPMGGEWFHQHFGVSKGPLRLTAWFGPVHPGKNSRAGAPGTKMTDYGAIDIRDGGTAIPYDMEDTFLRKEFEETLAGEGGKSRMENELYYPPRAAE
jgi:mannose-6-phosphate isomerase-like protein (cupin superfamily)